MRSWLEVADSAPLHADAVADGFSQTVEHRTQQPARVIRIRVDELLPESGEEREIAATELPAPVAAALLMDLALYIEQTYR